MNLFEISYDVENAYVTSPGQALERLVSALVHQLDATMINRFVASTLVFGTTRNYFEVLQVINQWAEANRVWFVIGQILPNEDRVRFYYTMRKDASLQAEVDDYMSRARRGML